MASAIALDATPNPFVTEPAWIQAGESGEKDIMP